MYTYVCRSMKDVGSRTLLDFTLFRRSAVKEPFFNYADNSPYFQVVNALWQLDEESNQERFLKSAQTRWKALYSVDEAARMNLLAKAAKRQDRQRLSAPFVLVRPQQKQATHSQRNVVVRVSPHRVCPHHHRLVACQPAPTVSCSIGMFCRDIGVDAESFFSPAVKGQVTFVTEIGKVAKVRAVFQKERRLYVETSAFHWKKSVLKTSISFIDALASKITKQMVEVNLLPESPRLTCQDVQQYCIFKILHLKIPDFI